MISLNIQIKLLVFSLIYGFLFSIALDILYPLIRKTNKFYQIILSFFFILLMAIIYFIAIDKIGYVIFHLYSILAIIIGFVSYDILIIVIAKNIKRWYINNGDTMASHKRKVAKSTVRRLRVFGVLSLICIIYFVFCLCYEVYEIHKLKIEEANLKEEYKNLKKEEKDLTVKIDQLNNPEYLASYARENYSYSKDGEYIIKLKDKDKKVKKVENDIKVNYVIIGLGIFVVVIFTSIIIRGGKKNK